MTAPVIPLSSTRTLDIEAAAMDGLLYAATLWIDRDPNHHATFSADRVHLRNAVYAMISATSRASDRASRGITFDGRWLHLVECVRAREAYSVGSTHARDVLGCPVSDDDAATYTVSQACRDRLDAAVLDAARELYRGARS